MDSDAQDWRTHAKEARRVLEEIASVRLAADAIAVAQVHALLALAAAVAESSKSSETPRP
jgi:hypothetical protein